MKTRIGSRNYNTDTAELIGPVCGGDLYRKRTRNHEYFLVTESENCRLITPLEDKAALSLLGKDAGTLHTPEPIEGRVRVDLDTHARIAAAAKREGVSMSEIVRRLAQSL